jgi:hypothetical protein
MSSAETAAEEWVASTRASLNSLSAHYVRLIKTAHTPVPTDGEADKATFFTQALLDQQAAEEYALALQNPDLEALPPSTAISPAVVAKAELSGLETRLAAQCIVESAGKLLSLIRQLKMSVLLSAQDDPSGLVAEQRAKEMERVVAEIKVLSEGGEIKVLSEGGELLGGNHNP